MSNPPNQLGNSPLPCLLLLYLADGRWDPQMDLKRNELHSEDAFKNLKPSQYLDDHKDLQRASGIRKHIVSHPACRACMNSHGWLCVCGSDEYSDESEIHFASSGLTANGFQRHIWVFPPLYWGNSEADVSVPDSVEIWGNYCANGIEAYEGLQSCKKIRDLLGMPNYPISSSMRGHYSTAGQNEAERKGMQGATAVLETIEGFRKSLMLNFCLPIQYKAERPKALKSPPPKGTADDGQELHVLKLTHNPVWDEIDLSPIWRELDEAWRGLEAGYPEYKFLASFKKPVSLGDRFNKNNCDMIETYHTRLVLNV
ncbi:hypothetical protein FB451DRAFT_1371619 [Mycena latifolia]|nr:hypothetical protein FB451DRAFT_1371619 [Mycena latifolia]